MQKPRGTTLTRAETIDWLRAMRRKNNPAIGDVMTDGTIYAGRSPTTHQPMYAAPKDAPLTMNFNQATEYTAKLEVGGKKDFRIPDAAELLVLFMNKDKGALKGTFNKSGLGAVGWYRSSTPVNKDGFAINRQFKDGATQECLQVLTSSLRCIR